MFHSGILKILYASPDILVMYECYLVSRSGHCSPQHNYVEIIGRPHITKIPENVINVINQRLDAACLNPESLIMVRSESE